MHTTPTITRVTLPTRFYDDHDDRLLPSGTLVKRTRRSVTVDLDPEAFADLLSDARHYADPVNGYAAESPGLVASARATVRALEA